MPNIRLALWGVLAAILFLNYQTWLHDYETPPAAPAAQTSTGTAPTASAAASPLSSALPQAAPSAAPNAAPQAANSAPPAAAVPGSSAAPPASEAATTPLRVSTDVLEIGINLKGGELDQADLKDYPLRKDTPNIPVRLLSYEPPPTLYLLQSGLIGTAGEAAPTHLAEWKSDQKSFVLAPGATMLRVPLTWTDGAGLTVTKTFTFKRGQYAIGLDYEVKNDGSAPRKLASYAQILRHWEHASRSYFDVETYSFKGPAVYDGTKSKDLNVESDSDSKYSAIISNGWLASLQHQFVAAVVPPANRPYQYQLQVRDHEYLISATGPMVEVPAGGAAQFHEDLFVGPKLQSQLAAMGRNLERTVDFGILTVLAQPLFTGLNWVHKLTGNWGWSIIIVTLLIKLLFYPLQQGQRPFHGQDARGGSAHEADSGNLQGRPREVGPRHDGAVQEGEDQSVGGLPADDRADSRVHLLLPGAAGERGNAPGAIPAMDQ